MTRNDSLSSLRMDRLLHILANKYRRRLLVALLEHNPQDEKNPLAETEGDDIESLKIAMIHSHLPKLEEAGFIEWDRERHAVRKGPRFDQIRPLLELMQSHADELPDDWI